jgi:GNAT superfamily N-acetyltransferase
MPHAGVSDLVIRQLEPSDAPLIRDAFAALSMESRYLRYGLPVVDPAVALAWVPKLDGERNVALGALSPGDCLLTGGARYASVDDGAYAEVAVTVIDAWQGQGVGSALLAALLAQARRAAVPELRACLLPGNRRAQRLLTAQGGWRLLSRRDGFVEYGCALTACRDRSPLVA